MLWTLGRRGIIMNERLDEGKKWRSVVILPSVIDFDRKWVFDFNEPKNWNDAIYAYPYVYLRCRHISITMAKYLENAFFLLLSASSLKFHFDAFTKSGETNHFARKLLATKIFYTRFLSVSISQLIVGRCRRRCCLSFSTLYGHLNDLFSTQCTPSSPTREVNSYGKTFFSVHRHIK